MTVKDKICLLNIRNNDLYNAYYSLLNKVITSYQSIFAEILRLKEARKTLTYNPSLKYYLTPIIPPPEDSAHFFDAQIVEHNIKEDIALYNIIDFTIDGLYEELKDLDEYKHCIQVMDSDATIKPHTNRGIVILHVHQNLTHWRYISHFLKSMVFHYFDNNYVIDVDAFSRYYNDLESFFYQNQLELVDVTPLHHFIFVNKKQVPTPVSIILSPVLRIVPVTRENKIRLWNRFPISRVDKSRDGIEYIFEYNFKSDKYSRLEVGIDTHRVFSVAVTLLRLVGNDCGIYDRTTITRPDLPINLIGLDFSVASLGVEHSSHPQVDLPTLDNFKKFWDKYSNLLLKKVFDNKRYEGDRFANLKISIARFNDAFERKDGTDAFIDNVVALEALFSKKDDTFSSGKTERLSKRLAVFLEKDPHRREELFCEMTRLYWQRNEIIHGGYTEKYDIIKTRKYLIRSYLKYFEFLRFDNFSHTAFIKLLDLDLSLITKKSKDCAKNTT